MIVIFCLDVICNNETVILLYLYGVLEKMSLEKMPLSEIYRKVPHGKKRWVIVPPETPHYLENCPPRNFWEFFISNFFLFFDI